jgi:hypothetical protein
MTASPESLQQRYEAIERVYSERQWDDVARLSEALLLELPDDASHPLRQRLQLLLGHTYLYGYQDAATATGFYNRVRAATSEAVLRDIADQGLEQCANQTVTPTAEPTTADAAATDIASAGQAFPFSAEAVNPTPPGGDAMAAMPWMEQLGGIDPAAVKGAPISPADPAPVQPSAVEASAIEPVAVAEPVSVAEPMPQLVVEVIDEPELIEVAQADPATAQDLEVAVTAESPVVIAERPHPAEPINSFSPEEIADLSKGLLRVVIR